MLGIKRPMSVYISEEACLLTTLFETRLLSFDRSRRVDHAERVKLAEF